LFIGRTFSLITLTSLGGAGTVTGSKHLLEHGGRRLLLDCGLFQGQKALREQNWSRLPVAADSLDAVVLSHAHLDHSGYLPKLVKDGFHRRIVCTHATMELSDIILRDSGHLQESDAEFANRHGFSRHRPALPLYGVRDAEKAMSHFAPIAVHQPLELPGGARLTLRRAGHILGAATVEIEWDATKVVFSGDLGRYGDAVMLAPDPVAEADYLIVESTYGDRRHDQADPSQVLGDVIERTTRRGGTVVIPAFAVGRAQSLLYHIWRLKAAGRIGLVPIYLDSPMAINAPITGSRRRSATPRARSPPTPATSRIRRRSLPIPCPRLSSPPAAWRRAGECCTTSRPMGRTRRTPSCSPGSRPRARAGRPCWAARAR
jgi:metallo-beta-lactamase family protein